MTLVRHMFPSMPYEPVTLGLKFAIRVHHLTARDVVVVTCPMCHARFNVAAHHFYARYHELRCLIDIEKDFKCKKCGAKRDLKWHVMRAVGPKFPSVA